MTHAGTIESDTVKAIEFRRSPSGAFGALELENLKDGDIQNKQTWYSAEKIVLAESVLMIEMFHILAHLSSIRMKTHPDQTCNRPVNMQLPVDCV